LLPDTDAAGAENQARYLTAALQASPEVEVELAYFGEGRAHRSFVELGVPMRQIPRRRRLRYELLGRARRLRAAYGDRPPRILHTWLREANIVGLIAARGWPDTRVVISQRGSWNELDSRAYVQLQRLLAGRADRAISNSEDGALALARTGVSPDRISVIHNGVPRERVLVHEARDKVRAAHGWAEASLVAWVGRGDPKALEQKDLVMLFNALELLRKQRPQVRLALIGPTREDLTLSGIALPDWAVALGWQEHAADYINAADLVAISSRTEGESNVAGEALLLGLSVATTDCGAHASLVRSCGGVVVDPGDAGGLADGMRELLVSPPDRSAVAAKAEASLAIDRMAQETLRVYSDALSESAHRSREG
jgi:glycosyltransferase involved in cell wall biosynthesis